MGNRRGADARDSGLFSCAAWGFMALIAGVGDRRLALGLLFTLLALPALPALSGWWELRRATRHPDSLAREDSGDTALKRPSQRVCCPEI